jgi:hypothetical protein
MVFGSADGDEGLALVLSGRILGSTELFVLDGRHNAKNVGLRDSR